MVSGYSVVNAFRCFFLWPQVASSHSCPKLSLCAAFSQYYFADSCFLVSLDTQLCLLRELGEPARLPLDSPYLCCGLETLKRVSWFYHRALLICFLSLGDHCPVSLVISVLEISISPFCLIFWLF